MRKSVLLLFGLAILLQSCTYAIRYDGTYSGKVVDAETREPIESAVVLGTWYTVVPTVAGGVSQYYDARETVTDKNGNFSIPGMGLRIMSNLEPMHFLIFKAGYEYIGPVHWASLKVDILLSKKITWEGNKPIIPLKKLTMEERKKQGTPDIYVEERVIEHSDRGLPVHSLFIPKNVRLIVREINKELIEQGNKPIEGE